MNNKLTDRIARIFYRTDKGAVITDSWEVGLLLCIPRRQVVQMVIDNYQCSLSSYDFFITSVADYEAHSEVVCLMTLNGFFEFIEKIAPHYGLGRRATSVRNIVRCDYSALTEQICKQAERPEPGPQIARLNRKDCPYYF